MVRWGGVKGKSFVLDLADPECFKRHSGYSEPRDMKVRCVLETRRSGVF